MSLNAQTIRGVLCDITGVVYDSGGKAIDGSPEAIRRLKESGIPLRFVTNESQCGRQRLVNKLQALGFDGLINVEEVFSPGPAVIAVLRARGLRPFLLAHPDDIQSLPQVWGDSISSHLKNSFGDLEMKLDFSSIRGVLLDISGVVVDSGPGNTAIAIPGSPDAVKRLRDAGIPFRFVSNASIYHRDLALKMIRSVGFKINVHELFLPAPAVAKILASRGLRPFLLVHKHLLDDFKGIDVTSPNCVVVGDASEHFTFANMNRAFQILINEKEPLLFALGKGKYYKHDGELTLDLGAYVSALEYSCDVKAQIYGKPTKEFFEAAIRDMGLDPTTDEILMIGDDLVNDVGGAQSCGYKAALVRTGKYRVSDENHPTVKPDIIVDNLAAAVDLLLRK